MSELRTSSFRLDAATWALLDALAARYGVTRAAALRFIVREAAQRAGLELPPLTPADLERPRGRPRRRTEQDQ
jgi:hypothetical protein